MSMRSINVEGNLVEYPNGNLGTFPTKDAAIRAAKAFARKQKPGFMVTVDDCGKTRDGAWVLQKNGRLLEARYVK